MEKTTLKIDCKMFLMDAFYELDEEESKIQGSDVYGWFRSEQWEQISTFDIWSTPRNENITK